MAVPTAAQYICCREKRLGTPSPIIISPIIHTHHSSCPHTAQKRESAIIIIIIIIHPSFIIRALQGEEHNEKEGEKQRASIMPCSWGDSRRPIGAAGISIDLQLV
jgi:hypothetical protein